MFERTVPKSIAVPHPLTSSNKNNPSCKSFAIETLGHKTIDADEFFNSLNNPQHFINTLIRQKINQTRQWNENSNNNGGIDKFHPAGFDSRNDSSLSQLQTVCMKLDYERDAVVLTTNSENLEPLELEIFKFRSIRVWSCADFDTRYVCFIISNGNGNYKAHFFRYDVSAIQIVASINDMSTRVEDKKAARIRIKKREKRLTRRMTTIEKSRFKNPENSDYNDNNPQRRHSSGDSFRENYNDISGALDGSLDFTKSQVSMLRRKNASGKNSNLGTLRNWGSTMSIVSSCLSEYAIRGDQDILKVFNRGDVHYLGFANLSERVRTSELALGLIERLVEKTQQQNNFDQMELLKKPQIKLTISANSITMSKLEFFSDFPSIVGGFGGNDITTKHVRTRYLAWLILSKKSQFLGLVEHAEKVRVHLIWHEKDAKHLADCIQQACLIRYQKMIDSKI